MITLDFSLAVAFYMLAMVSLFVAAWVLMRIRKDKDLSLDPRFIWFCAVCTYNYVNTKEESLSICPRCGSYNKKIS